uniref:Uncharacterized protein n=1 Tax=Setaria viridis TaxID=4556 RepID=A0A4U6UYL9_SETVI|nr:hypothetical protein SEVIR_4G147501v2 [Setaria viridis]
MEMAERWLLAPKKASIWLREFYFSWRVRIHPLLCVQEKKENYSPWRARPRWATKIWICCCCGYTSKSGQCFQEVHWYYALSRNIPMDLLIWCCSKLPQLKNPVGI